MLIILKKIFLIILLLAVNLYIYEYAGNKIAARMELRRGYRMSGLAGIEFPVARLINNLSSGSRVNVWTFFIFLLSFLIWGVVPLSSNLVLVDKDYSLLIALVFYIAILIMLILNSSRSVYTKVFSEDCKKVLILISFLIPLLVSVLSIILLNKTLGLKEIVDSQHKYWNIMLQPLGFLVFSASAFFQIKLLGMVRKGYISTGVYNGKEGSGFGKAVEKISIYMIVFFLIIILSLLYLGGWQSFFIIRGEIMLAFKFYFIFVIFLLMDKITVRMDSYKLMLKINWKFLVPVSLVNFIVTLGFFVARDVYGLILV
jgi:NADH-quinone oxidoreductase subunit H